MSVFSLHEFSKSFGMKMHIRQAIQDDLDAIVEIHFEAFHDEPDMDYPFPHRRDFPEFMKTSTRERFRSYLVEPEIYLVMVACSKTNEDDKIVKPVAYAAWRLKDIDAGETLDTAILNLVFEVYWQIIKYPVQT